MIDKSLITDIFFDLDHTLWDFEKNSALTFEKIFTELNISIDLPLFLEYYVPINHEQWKRYRNNEISQQDLRYNRLALTFKKINMAFDQATVNKISDLYVKYLSSFTNLFKGTFDLLDMKKKKYALHIITNGFESIQLQKIEISGLKHYFDFVFTADKIGQKKPHPLIFKTALEDTQTKSENALMIGDSWEADINTPLKMGFQAIHFNSHQEEKHSYCLQVNQLSDIHTFFK